MIEAAEFVDRARALGFDWYAGVPCSFLSPFINYVINSDDLTYVCAANEGDAVAAAAGANIGGHGAVVMMQNSGLGNAVSPLSSLAYVFRIPMLIICTHRGAPGVHDEPQHALMGQITTALFDSLQIPWAPFPVESEEIDPILQRVHTHCVNEQRPFALIMPKGAVAAHALSAPKPSKPPSPIVLSGSHKKDSQDYPLTRALVLARIVANTPATNTLLVATTGFTSRELYAVADRDNHLYMVGSMGCARQPRLRSRHDPHGSGSRPDRWRRRGTNAHG